MFQWGASILSGAVVVRKSSGTNFLFGGGMLDQWSRAEHYRHFAEECRRLAATSFSAEMRNCYWRMAEHYSTLAEAEGPGHTGLPRLVASEAPVWERAKAGIAFGELDKPFNREMRRLRHNLSEFRGLVAGGHKVIAETLAWIAFADSLVATTYYGRESTIEVTTSAPRATGHPVVKARPSIKAAMPSDDPIAARAAFKRELPEGPNLTPDADSALRLQQTSTSPIRAGDNGKRHDRFSDAAISSTDDRKVAEIAKALLEWRPNLDSLDALADDLTALVMTRFPDATLDQIQQALEIAPFTQWLRLDRLVERVLHIECEVSNLVERKSIMTINERREGVLRLLGMVASAKKEMLVIERLTPEEVASLRAQLDRVADQCLSLVHNMDAAIMVAEWEWDAGTTQH